MTSRLARSKRTGGTCVTKALAGADFSTLEPFAIQNIQTDQSSNLKLIPLLEAYAQAEYDVKQFEEFSGRLAMVALTGAIGLEMLMGGQGVFEGLDSVVVTCYSLFTVATLMSSVQIAAILAERGVSAGERALNSTLILSKDMAKSYQTFQRERAVSLKKAIQPVIDSTILTIYEDINVSPPVSSQLVPIRVESSREGTR